MALPAAFAERMKKLLGEEYPAFEKSLAGPRAHGLRVNPLRTSPQAFAARGLFSLTPVPWCQEGFYYPADERPGKHPLYEAGVYYIQEPSAMAVGALAQAKRGEWVLDLCAAPGGKTTHLAGQMAGEGLLFANEIHPARAKILAQSVERAGISNAVVLNETPQRLAERFAGCFDCVVVDAPCSGEGMFRKDEGASDEWTAESPALCAARQDEILEQAAALVRPGGRMIYSTCTFAPEENEGTISRFLEKRPDFTIIVREDFPWFSQGRPDWWEGAMPETIKTFRLWPHRIDGEGHFCACLRRDGDDAASRPAQAKTLAEKEIPEAWRTFAEETFLGQLPGKLLRGGDRLWLTPPEMPDLSGLRVLRTGLEAGTLQKGRLVPAHALALALRPEQVRRTLPLRSEEDAAVRYLQGETLPCETENGWTLVTVDGYPLGWGKSVNGVLKNHYPKGLRWV